MSIKPNKKHNAGCREASKQLEDIIAEIKSKPRLVTFNSNLYNSKSNILGEIDGMIITKDSIYYFEYKLSGHRAKAISQLKKEKYFLQKVFKKDLHAYYCTPTLIEEIK